jgi:hypothetical protein
MEHSMQRRTLGLSTVAAAILCVFGARSTSHAQDAKGDAKAPTLDETRLALEKWIDTQKLVAKERNEWQQGREILTNRIDLVKREIAALEEKIDQAQKSVAETNARRDELLKQKAQAEATRARLSGAVGVLEGQVRALLRQLPEPQQAHLEPLRLRMPDADKVGRVTTAERFQNVIGILNDVNQSNNEIRVTYEVRELAGGRPAEVRVLYVGLAQAWYVSASGEAGVGRPSADGWKWTPDPKLANDVLTALEIQQGKHSPEFVPLPVRLQ